MCVYSNYCCTGKRSGSQVVHWKTEASSDTSRDGDRSGELDLIETVMNEDGISDQIVNSEIFGDDILKELEVTNCSLGDTIPLDDPEVGWPQMKGN